MTRSLSSHRDLQIQAQSIAMSPNRDVGLASDGTDESL